MINPNKYDCCGCFACLQSCPKQCISKSTDKEGFDYPIVDEKVCVDCGLCEKVCPIINVSGKKQPLKVLAAKNKDKQIVAKSSSGGVFFSIARKVIEQGGVVFGARFDENWMVIHDYTDTLSGLSPFMTSKYVQSSIGDTYSKAKKFLNDGRIVLFTGTPCQIAGLHSFLRKYYDNLITVDFLCHGVPSPLVWRKYLERELDYIEKDISSIQNINFRDKSDGWKYFRLSIHFSVPKNNNSENLELSSPHKENKFMKGFLNDLYLRPSCHKCRFKRFQSKSDITIADFWAISKVDPAFYEPDGVSMIFVNTILGDSYIDSNNFNIIETRFEDTLSNKGLHECTPEHLKRDYFFENFENTSDITKIIDKCVDPPVYKRMGLKSKNLLKRIWRKLGI